MVHNIKDGNVWVLDPIDGTVNFIVQQDNFCVMIAYYEEGQGKFGLIYNVMADQLFYGGGQFDVYCNDKLLPAYKNPPLDLSLIHILSPHQISQYYDLRKNSVVSTSSFSLRQRLVVPI